MVFVLKPEDTSVGTLTQSHGGVGRNIAGGIVAVCSFFTHWLLRSRGDGKDGKQSILCISCWNRRQWISTH